MQAQSLTQPLLETRNLQMYFPVGGSFLRRSQDHVHAVDDVNLSILPGQTLGLVGESGCGKTTIGRIVSRLLEPTSGSILFDGEDVSHIKGNELRRYRPNVQVVFQDPFTSLNPRLSAREIVAEPLKINHWGTQPEIDARVDELLFAVGLSPDNGDRLPNEFSGGQRQRIAIARALALNPRLIVCDEPVSALDVSIQATILNLLVDLQKRFQLTYLFISHDLSVVRLIANEVAVMYMGKIVEQGPTEKIFSNPMHPYTVALMAAVPDPYDRGGVSILPGEVPSNIHPPQGCYFHTRCPSKMDICSMEQPRLEEAAQEQLVSCFLYDENMVEKQISLEG